MLPLCSSLFSSYERSTHTSLHVVYLSILSVRCCFFRSITFSRRVCYFYAAPIKLFFVTYVPNTVLDAFVAKCYGPGSLLFHRVTSLDYWKILDADLRYFHCMMGMITCIQQTFSASRSFSWVWLCRKNIISWWIEITWHVMFYVSKKHNLYFWMVSLNCNLSEKLNKVSIKNWRDVRDNSTVNHFFTGC